MIKTTEVIEGLTPEVFGRLDRNSDGVITVEDEPRNPIPIEPDDREELLRLLLQLLADAVLKGANELDVDEVADVFPEAPSELVEAMDEDDSWTVSESEAKAALEVQTEDSGEGEGAGMDGDGEDSGLEGDTEGETPTEGDGETGGEGSPLVVCAAPAGVLASVPLSGAAGDLMVFGLVAGLFMFGRRRFPMAS